MKLVFEYKGKEKIMDDPQSYESVIGFIQHNFKLKNNWSISYRDSDGDQITISEDSDLLTMKQYLSDNQEIKVFITEDTLDEENDSEEQKTQIKEEVRNDEENQHKQVIQVKQELINDDKKQTNSQLKASQISEEPKKNSQYNVIDIPKINQEIEQIYGDDAENKEGFNCRWGWGWGRHRNGHGHHHEMWRKKIEEKMAKFVDDRIETLMPCIIKQVEEKLRNKDPKPVILEQISQLKHEVKCNGCGTEQIFGIRYKCVKCPLFNLCQKCESEVVHQHNMIKMRFVEQEVRQESHHHRPKHFKEHCWFGMKNHGEKHRFWRPRIWLTEKCYRLSKCFGGCAKDYEQFVLKKFELKFDELLKLYSSQNKNIKINQQEKQNKKQKCQKLAFYFNQPSQKYIDIVNKYPFSNLRQLIQAIQTTKQQSQIKTEKVQVDENTVDCTRDKFVRYMTETNGYKQFNCYVEFFNNNSHLQFEQLIKLYAEKKK